MGEKLTVNGREYSIIKLLGKGKGGYSYLVEADGKKYVLKQIHHEPCEYYTFGDKLQAELNDYARLCAVGINIPELIDVDKTNERILKEYIDGDNVMELVKTDRLPKSAIDAVREMCKPLYAAKLNIDYFPTNFIVVATGELYYIDFECNEYSDEWNFENWGVKYWSKTPELAAYLAENE